MKRTITTAALMLSVIACPEPKSTTTTPPAAATIGPDGGTLEIAGLKLTVPPGALREPKTITAQRVERALPEGFTAFSPIFHLEPQGLVFRRPVEVAIEVGAGARPTSAYLTTPGGTGWQQVGGRLEGSTLTARILHFSDIVSADEEAFDVVFEDGPALELPASSSPPVVVTGDGVPRRVVTLGLDRLVFGDVTTGVVETFEIPVDVRGDYAEAVIAAATDRIDATLGFRGVGLDGLGRVLALLVDEPEDVRSWSSASGYRPNTLAPFEDGWMIERNGGGVSFYPQEGRVDDVIPAAETTQSMFAAESSEGRPEIFRLKVDEQGAASIELYDASANPFTFTGPVFVLPLEYMPAQMIAGKVDLFGTGLLSNVDFDWDGVPDVITLESPPGETVVRFYRGVQGSGIELANTVRVSGSMSGAAVYTSAQQFAGSAGGAVVWVDPGVRLLRIGRDDGVSLTVSLPGEGVLEGASPLLTAADDDGRPDLTFAVPGSSMVNLKTFLAKKRVPPRPGDGIAVTVEVIGAGTISSDPFRIDCTRTDEHGEQTGVCMAEIPVHLNTDLIAINGRRTMFERWLQPADLRNPLEKRQRIPRDQATQSWVAKFIPVRPEPLLAAGTGLSVARTCSRAPAFWGDNGIGTFGIGGTTGVFVSPVEAAWLADADAVDVTYKHACAVRGGVVSCAGWNRDRAISGSTNDYELSPFRIDTPHTDYIGITVGETHACAWTEAGAADCFGSLVPGNGTFPAGPVGPTRVSLTGIQQMDAGVNGTCAMVEGLAYCWGGGAHVRIGEEGPATGLPTPVPADDSAMPRAPLVGVAEVGVGGVHSCARTIFGTVVCWGSDGGGELGDGPAMSPVQPVQTGLTDIVDLDVADTHTCAVSGAGDVFCWGENREGAVDPAEPAARVHAPIRVSGVTGAVQVAAGRDHTCARLQNGAVTCWGNNNGGQVGTGGVSSRQAPYQVLPACE